MKKFIADHFDKLLMLAVTFVFLACWLYFSLPELARLTELSFIGLTTLVGGRRGQQNNIDAEKIQVDEVKTESLDLTTPEAIGAVENIKEVSPEKG